MFRCATLRIPALILAAWIGTILASHSGAQELDANPDDARENIAQTGYVIDVPVPLETGASARLIDQLKRLSESAPGGRRVTVVLRYAADLDPMLGNETAFEDALRLARAMTQPELRKVKVVSLVEGEVGGHSTLPILASDLLLVGRNGKIVDASGGEEAIDETVSQSYELIAARRGLFSPAIVKALIDPALELALVSKVGGEQVFASGKELDQLRDDGEVLGEEIWSAAGVPLVLEARKLRANRIAAGLVESMDQAGELLDLAALNPIEGDVAIGAPSGILLEVTGAIASNRVRRWQSNLLSTLESGEVNTWVVTIDSGGGSLGDSVTLADWFAEPEPPLRTVAGLIRGEARGDAALIALACQPLYMKPDATLGGPGSDSILPDRLDRFRDEIERIGRATKRPAALIRGILDPTLEVFRYTHKKTGRIRYATEQDLVADVEDPELERERWERGEKIELSEGLTVSQAVALGLAEGESRSIEDASRRVGLSGSPPPVADRGLIRFIEKIGRSNTLAFLLLFIGFSALSAEANAPGLSIPGFVALVCFALYFWMKFLAGTAEWLELVAFSLGLICIAIEIFVVPGFGIFGIGGLALTVLGIVLMSQTFVIPRNVYQLEILSRGVWVALGGAAGMIGGFFVMRMMMPHVPILRGLVMEAPNEEVISESEKLADFAYLLGQQGVSTTPLRPSGKARFGEEVVQVVSDGSAIGSGEAVRVSEVHGAKVVVEAVET